MKENNDKSCYSCCRSVLQVSYPISSAIIPANNCSSSSSLPEYWNSSSLPEGGATNIVGKNFNKHTVNPLLSPPGGLFISSTFERGEGVGLDREGGLFRSRISWIFPYRTFVPVVKIVIL